MPASDYIILPCGVGDAEIYRLIVKAEIESGMRKPICNQWDIETLTGYANGDGAVIDGHTARQMSKAMGYKTKGKK